MSCGLWALSCRRWAVGGWWYALSCELCSHSFGSLYVMYHLL